MGYAYHAAPVTSAQYGSHFIQDQMDVQVFHQRDFTKCQERIYIASVIGGLEVLSCCRNLRRWLKHKHQQTDDQQKKLNSLKFIGINDFFLSPCGIPDQPTENTTA